MINDTNKSILIFSRSDKPEPEETYKTFREGKDDSEFDEISGGIRYDRSKDNYPAAEDNSRSSDKEEENNEERTTE